MSSTEVEQSFLVSNSHQGSSLGRGIATEAMKQKYVAHMLSARQSLWWTYCRLRNY
jgi:hypothetical protein